MRNFSAVRRVVIKIGTNVLTRSDRLDGEYIASIARQVVALRAQGYEVCIVTSGAIGLGAAEIGHEGRVQDVVLRQACAAIGQPLLMQVYREAFTRAGVTAAQVLLTREVLNARSSYVKLRNAVERLLDLGVVPIFNENDSVATAEIGSAFGDNDQLSALIASKVDAGLLILLSDVDGYYDRDPREDAHAQRIEWVDTVTDEMIAGAGRAGSKVGTGGMATKLKAVRIAAEGGCRVVLAHGREADVVTRIVAGETVGTLFVPRRTLKNRTRWLLHSSARGTIHVDEGALSAIRRHKSLLPTGVLSVDGSFDVGDVVMVNDDAKLITSFSSSELRAILGHHSSEFATLLDADGDRTVIARPEDMVFLDDGA